MEGGRKDGGRAKRGMVAEPKAELSEGQASQSGVQGQSPWYGWGSGVFSDVRNEHRRKGRKKGGGREEDPRRGRRGAPLGGPPPPTRVRRTTEDR